jgi:hypothetical protein
MPTPTDFADLPDLPDDDDEHGPDDGDDGDDDDDVVTGLGTAPVAPPEPPPPAPKKPRGRPRTREPRGVASPPPAAVPRQHGDPWASRDVESLWPEILTWAKAQGHSPYDIDIRVKQTSPNEMIVGEPFNGASVQGNEGKSASAQIVEKITNEYHIPSGVNGPATYSVQFFWRVNSMSIKWGVLRLASPEQILSIRRNQQAAGAQHGPPPPGYGAPPPPPYYQPQSPYGPHGPPQPPQGYYPPYPTSGFGAPPPAPAEPARGRDREAYLEGVLDEVLRAQREGRQAVIPPPPVAETPSVDSIALRVVEMLRPHLPGFGAVAAVATVPPPVPLVVASPVQSTMEQITSSLMQGVLKKVGDSISSAIRGEGLGALPGTPEPAVVAEVVDPSGDLPFTTIPIPESKWNDGRPVNFTRNKETGNIDYGASLMANPILLEKIGDAAAGLIGSVSEVVKGIGRSTIPGGQPQGHVEVVQNIPRNAVNVGAGQVQPPQQAPQAPTAPAKNGAPQQGNWPKSV